MSDAVATSQTILVVGGGISGMTAALEAAECGKEVVLVERNPSLGGRVAQLYRYFPKLCHPTCGLEINLRRLRAQKRVRLLTMAEVTRISGRPGGYTAEVLLHPRHVNERCTACGACGEAVEAEFADEHDYGLATRKGAYLPFNMAYPQRYVLDPRIIGTQDAERAHAACRYDAIELDQQPQAVRIQAGAVVWTTGWRPYDAAKIQPYGYERNANVVTSVEFERMLDPFGPTRGELVRPSDGKPAKDVAFIQCAGSRDRNHLAHCSRICCMASLKQSTYPRERWGDEARATIYYIDIRAIDRFEDFYAKVRADANVRFVKSKVASVTRDAKTGDPVCNGVDTEGYHRYANRHDLVVLAIGMEPSVQPGQLPVELNVNRNGFIENDPAAPGIFAAGCAADSVDVNRAVQSATAAAMHAIQVVNRAARAEAAA